jgi:hypothetical protein
MLVTITITPCIAFAKADTMESHCIKCFEPILTQRKRSQEGAGFVTWEIPRHFRAKSAIVLISVPIGKGQCTLPFLCLTYSKVIVNHLLHRSLYVVKLLQCCRLTLGLLRIDCGPTSRNDPISTTIVSLPLKPSYQLNHKLCS